MSAISKLKNVFAIAATATIAYGACGVDVAQAYGMHTKGGGGSVLRNLSVLKLDYPDGTEHEFTLPHSDRDPKGFEAQVVPLLKDYVANVFPRMPQSVQDDTSFSSFATVIGFVAGDIGWDEVDLAKEVGYDPALIKKFRDFVEIDRAEYLRQEMVDLIQGVGSGYASYDADMIYSLSELNVDKVNDAYADLRAKYPNNPAYNVSDFDYKVLVDARKVYARSIAQQASKLMDDVYNGRVDPDRMTDDQKDTVDLFVYSMLEPEAYYGVKPYSPRIEDAISKGNLVHYNNMIPGFIDQELIDTGMSYADRMKFYAGIFDLRRRFDLRPLPKERAFLRNYSSFTNMTDKVSFRPTVRLP